MAEEKAQFPAANGEISVSLDVKSPASGGELGIGSDVDIQNADEVPEDIMEWILNEEFNLGDGLRNKEASESPTPVTLPNDSEQKRQLPSQDSSSPNKRIAPSFSVRTETLLDIENEHTLHEGISANDMPCPRQNPRGLNNTAQQDSSRNSGASSLHLQSETQDLSLLISNERNVEEGPVRTEGSEEVSNTLPGSEEPSDNDSSPMDTENFCRCQILGTDLFIMLPKAILEGSQNEVQQNVNNYLIMAHINSISSEAMRNIQNGSISNEQLDECRRSMTEKLLQMDLPGGEVSFEMEFSFGGVTQWGRIILTAWEAAYEKATENILDINKAALTIYNQGGLRDPAEEGRRITLSGRANTSRFPPRTIELIYHAVASMKKRLGVGHYHIDDRANLTADEEQSINKALIQRLRQINRNR